MSPLSILVPARSLQWGRLTTESLDWHRDAMRYVLNATYAAIGERLLPVLESIADAMGPVLLDLFGDPS